MKTWEVTIEAKVTKTYTVDAENEDEATETAHSIFSVLNDDTPENYDEETLEVVEVEKPQGQEAEEGVEERVEEMNAIDPIVVTLYRAFDGACDDNSPFAELFPLNCASITPVPAADKNRAELELSLSFKGQDEHGASTYRIIVEKK